MTCRRADSLAAGLTGVTCKATESHPVAAGSWGPSAATAQRQYQSQIPTSGLGLIEKLESSEGKRLHRDLLCVCGGGAYLQSWRRIETS